MLKETTYRHYLVFFSNFIEKKAKFLVIQKTVIQVASLYEGHEEAFLKMGKL